MALPLSDIALTRGSTRPAAAQEIGAAPYAPVDREAAIRRLYRDQLGVVNPDQAGLDFWMNQGWRDNEAELIRQMRGGAGLNPDPPESVNQALLADKNYAAFLRGMQFDESQIQSSLQAAQEAAQRRITAQRDAYDLQRTQGEEGIQRSYEARQNRSGRRLLDIARNRSQIDRQQTQFETGIGDQTAQLERQAAADIASLRRQRAEQELGARDRLTQRSMEYPV